MSDGFASIRLIKARRVTEGVSVFQPDDKFDPRVVGLQTVEPHALGSKISDARGNDGDSLLRFRQSKHRLHPIGLTLNRSRLT
jgi:hypothetical protein